MPPDFLIAITGFDEKKILETANILKKKSDDFDVVTGNLIKRKHPFQFQAKLHGAADKDLIIYALSIEGESLLPNVKALIGLKTPPGVMVELFASKGSEAVKK